MLQVKNIAKKYKTGNLEQVALDGVSLNFRDHEFVAILGPSGSGKTTLLNIIGGLDRFDSGDLVIDGISTAKYKDRDWDTYRNHRIGFVFQSYNLIPHQTILANVELALTISGISKKERVERAKKALEEVGLGTQTHKRPNQLSGGQMQRVAIARALVNNPTILLADEPTGALDSETSLQVMELLKEVARDRLVIMVTHNPELAEQYATRIVRIQDGRVRDDTNPYEDADVFLEKPQKAKKHASMSFMTALFLSFNNLWTKKARTILVSFAGSIGIIGIALIMAISTGVKAYITDLENGTVLEYPVSVSKQGIDYSAIFGMHTDTEEQEEKEGMVAERQVLRKYAGGIKNNNLKALKQYVESGESDIQEYCREIEYSYSIIPQIFLENNNKIRQVLPDESYDKVGMDYSSAKMMNLTAFYELSTNYDLYENKYDLVAGKWPSESNECLVVLNADGSLSDMALYAMGLKDLSELDEMVKSLLTGNNVKDAPCSYVSYEDILGVSFKVISRDHFYQYDEESGLWVNRMSDQQYLKEQYEDGTDLQITGIVRPAKTNDAPMSDGIYYMSSLVLDLMDEASDSEAVLAQMKTPEINIFTGEKFGAETGFSNVNLQDLFAIDEEAMKKAFSLEDESLDVSSLDFSDMDLNSMDMENLDMGSLDFSGIDLASMDLSGLTLTEDEMRSLLTAVSVNVTSEDLNKLFSELLSGYGQSQAIQDLTRYPERAEAAINSFFQSEEMRSYLEEFVRNCIPDGSDLEGQTPEEILSNIQISDEAVQQLLTEVRGGMENALADIPLPTEEEIQKSFTDYVESDAVKDKLMNFLSQKVDMSKLQDQIGTIMAGKMSRFAEQLGSKMADAMAEVMEPVITAVIENLTGAIQGVMTDQFAGLGDQISDMISKQFVDAGANMGDMIKLGMSEDSLEQMIKAFLMGTSDSYEDNLLELGYASEDDPDSIVFYPMDFNGKTQIKAILDNYNEQVTDRGEEEKAVSYSDIAGTLMGSVESIVNVVSGVLIALVAVSLIVSSIMIGVITHISVLERKKEIGILRAIGASKFNIMEVFNAETFITGLMAGLIGIGIAEILVLLGNYVVHDVLNHYEITIVLPFFAAAMLVALSVLLNMISGLIPARKASKSDPVEALRSE